MKKHNFYAGPSILSQYTIKNTADAVLDFAGTGLSLLEISHRSKEFSAVMERSSCFGQRIIRCAGRLRCRIPRWRSQPAILYGAFQLAEKESGLSRNGTWAVKPSKRQTLR